MILCINAQGRFLRGLGPRLQMKLMVIPVGRSLVFSGSQAKNISYSTSQEAWFFRITDKKYFVLYRSQAKNISYNTGRPQPGFFRITGDPAPAPIASKEPEKEKRYFGLYLLVGGRKPYTIWNPIYCKDSWRDYYPSLLSETRTSTIPSSHATGRDPLHHTFDP